jgi:choline dehydrogenase-like flavoprotein
METLFRTKMQYDFDVIVMGGGAGGATFARACALAGKSVLVVDRASRHVVTSQEHDEQAMVIDKQPYDDRSVKVNGRSRRLFIGGVLGGSSSLYGAALVRPSREDFHPGRFYGERLPRATWDWPIGYEDLEPHYTEAETLFGVTGCVKDDFGPLARPRQGYHKEPLPLQPINRRLVSTNRVRGLKPFRLPLAIDFQRCLQCSACPGFICPVGARHSGADLLDDAIVRGAPLQVLTGVDVERLTLDGRGQIANVKLRRRHDGQSLTCRGKRYALAAGALSSPALLFKSGIVGSLIGRHYMFHLSPLVAGIFKHFTGADTSFVKQVGFADYYFGTKRFPHKLGLIQSLPVPGPLMLAKSAPKILPACLLRALRRRMLPLAGIVEDVPNPANRVLVNRNGGIELRHSFSAYDRERGRRLALLMKQILRRAGAMFCISKSLPSDEHVAHQCGTLRFGKNADSAVADADCRLFGYPNLFVVDSSFFPTSLGVGPALTIIANALRVARIVTREI